eukprot:CAMPEP_0205818808 /NCGR_PEP_ID=MMETSP0206-20130828/865_1 /ASSEMBLY_ACC=CAM_ASM_000279 /TAXON_ID=36767 /ORGANISM="Euplotes focardii, Strain TN1" /LENGTH=76 /DNA_ID=CAMNT_0053111567 /DNA_START=39 /DNA_END=269 /DNA_ORIENTATION=+
MADEIVVFTAEAKVEDIDAAVAEVEAAGGSVKFKYYQSPKPVLYGFAGNIPAATSAALKARADVKYVEANGVAKAL